MCGSRYFSFYSSLFRRLRYRAHTIAAGLLLLGFIVGFIVSHWHLLSSSVDLSNDPHRTILDDLQSM